jgi:hypothetical protein
MIRRDGMLQEPVILNVYDMMPINGYTKLFGIGVFHSGVEVYGSEYAYGGHLSTFTGIYDMNPKDSLVLGEDFKFKKSILLGYTPLKRQEVEQLVSHLGREYSGKKYSMISKNCNHFTKEFCLMLCGQSIPRWINRLANGINHLPFLRRLVERNMGLPTMVSQCCGSGMIDIDTAHDSDTESLENREDTIAKCWSIKSSSSSSEDSIKNDSNRNICCSQHGFKSTTV